MPSDNLRGAPPQRSPVHFSTGDDTMRHEVCHASGWMATAAEVETRWKMALIERVAYEVIAGELDHHVRSAR